MKYFKLGEGNPVSLIIKGCWQMSAGHGAGVTGDAAIEELLTFYDAGITTFDGGDIYTGVEELFGSFRKECLKRRGQEALQRLRFHTKFVPDLDALPTMNRQYVEHIVDRSLKRIGVDCLDLVQFHWWDFDIPGHVETAQHLAALQRAGKIKNIGVTNYDVAHLREIVESDITIVSNQVQYSVLDRRPQHGMIEFCYNNGITPLCYGSVAGGFISRRYLDTAEVSEPFVNRSLAKYKLIIDEAGGWSKFQEALQLLTQLSDWYKSSPPGLGKHPEVSDPAILGMAYIFNTIPNNAAIIAGGSSRSISTIIAVANLVYMERGMPFLMDKECSCLTDLPGDVYELERQKGGKHAAIMKYDLNKS